MATVTGEDVLFEHGGHRLAGTVAVPSGTRPHAAAVLLHGAYGPADRDSVHRPIREAFAQHGLAALSWDRPGTGGSTGDWRRQCTADCADEALAAVRFLQARADITADRIGLWGVSGAANAAAHAAAQLGALAFLIAVSPRAITLAELHVYGLEQQLRADGAPAAEVEAALRCARAMDAAARRGDSYAQVEATLLGPGRLQPWGRYFTAPPLPDAETWEFWRTRGGLPEQDDDPVPVWERVRCPALVIFGERDLVQPVATSAGRLTAALTQAGNRDVTIKVFPGAGHGIKRSGTTDFAPGYLDLMTAWVRQRVGLA